MKRLSVVALAFATASCAINPAPIPVVGTAADLSALAGEWTGEYRSAEAGRTGSITFKLAAGRDTAFGDVLMIPREDPLRMAEPSQPIVPLAPQPQILTISFVRVTGGSISGSLTPYPSPDCECQLLTTFRGQLKGDRIEGDLWINHSGMEMPAQKGTWWVKRVSAKATR
jgi:hypothetical protein